MGTGAKILRLLGGNPLIMKDMAKTVPDAAAYAPITILVDERADGVHLSYDDGELPRSVRESDSSRSRQGSRHKN